MASTANRLSALDFLTQRINYERTTTVPYLTSEFKLDRMRRLLALLGDPHLALKAVHIAGTKGKGSTAVMVASVLQAAGYRAGLYTSPHLERVEERIVVDGQRCPEKEFLRLVEQVQPAVELLDREGEALGGSGPTFFEVTTAMAFLHFARSRVDAAVLEVGLGGRLDSTNVCQPEVCIITTISFDHTKQLGNTLASIAGEKAGIIKPRVPVVSGVLEAEPRDVIRGRAAEAGARLYERGTSYEVVPHAAAAGMGGERFDYQEADYELANAHVNLIGRHQAANAATAICALRRLGERGWTIGEQHLRDGLAASHCPGRIEQVAASPTVILDVAHNVASIEAVVAALSERFKAQRRIALFASSKDKDYRGMLERVMGAFDVVFLTQYVHNPRAQAAEELLKTALEIRAATGGNRPALHAAVNPEYAWALARRAAREDDLICITGSFFLAAEMRSIVSTGVVSTGA